MNILILFGILPLIIILTSAQQVRFQSQSQTQCQSQGSHITPCNPTHAPVEDAYEFPWPIKDVAVIGAGVTGMLAYQALSARDTFSKIKVFERDDAPGGNWHYTDETPPSVPLSLLESNDWWKADYTPVIPVGKLPLERVHVIGANMTADEADVKWTEFRSPKPIWKSLKTNSPSPIQQIPGFPWPPRTGWHLHHSMVQRYLRSFASWLGINIPDQSPEIAYNTRVESVRKRLHSDGRQVGWKLVLHSYVKAAEGVYREVFWQENFDAIVVATGRFNVPHIPSIQGFGQWQDSFPNEIIHCRQYRESRDYRSKNVLIVGASDSAAGIAADILESANKVFLSVRDPKDDGPSRLRRELFQNMLPASTTIVGEIHTFRAPSTASSTTGMRAGEIELLNGTVLSGIDQIILATGYRYSFPFLSQYHNLTSFASKWSLSFKVRNSVQQENTAEIRNDCESPLITDGTHIQSLYLDTFYIDQPTIAFQGQNLNTQLFFYSKYTAEAISRVWARQAYLPSHRAMWDSFWLQVKDRGGLGRELQWLRAIDVSNNLRYFVTWLNNAAMSINHSPTIELLDLAPDIRELSMLWLDSKWYVPDINAER
ncbi:hypothetical protein IAT40_003090 [Kwoniella sp. CBS 6097]